MTFPVAAAACLPPRRRLPLTPTPGPVVQANVVYPAASLAPALGRPYVGGSTAVVNVIAPATEFGDRLNQVDFRVGKLIRAGKLRASLNVDLFNVFNANPVLTEIAEQAPDFFEPAFFIQPDAGSVLFDDFKGHGVVAAV